jgi:AcrR family transcriptional regulator
LIQPNLRDVNPHDEVQFLNSREENAITTRSDGQRTRKLILETAARMATVHGLDGLSIGSLASELKMSKSGVYAHFRSKEELQLATIDSALETFDREVVQPGLQAATPLGQLASVCEYFFSYLERRIFPGGCFFVTVAAEFDAKPGPVRERVAETQRNWMKFLEDLACAAQGDGSLAGDVDPAQLTFEINAFLEVADLLYLLLDDPGVIIRTKTAISSTLQRAAAAPTDPAAP